MYIYLLIMSFLQVIKISLLASKKYNTIRLNNFFWNSICVYTNLSLLFQHFPPTIYDVDLYSSRWNFTESAEQLCDVVMHLVIVTLAVKPIPTEWSCTQQFFNVDIERKVVDVVLYLRVKIQQRVHPISTFLSIYFFYLLL